MQLLKKARKDGNGAATLPVEDPSKEGSSQSNVDDDVSRHGQLVRKWTLAAWINLLLTAVWSLPLTFVCGARVGVYYFGGEGTINSYGLAIATTIFFGTTLAFSIASCVVVRRAKKKCEQQRNSASSLAHLRRTLRSITVVGATLFVLVLVLGTASYALADIFYWEEESNYYAQSQPLETVGSLAIAEEVFFCFLLVTLLCSVVFSALAWRQVRAPAVARDAETAEIARDTSIERVEEKHEADGADVEHVESTPPPTSSMPTWTVAPTPPGTEQSVAAESQRGFIMPGPSLTARADNPLLKSVV